MRGEQSVSSMLLSADERDRFAAWLEAEAATDEQLATQMERAGIRIEAAQEWRMNAAAKLRVARLLRATESVTL